MEQLFMMVLNMSITASYVIVIVIAARLLMRKQPKIYSYLLWAVVFLRLVCPYSIESMYSLIPSYERQTMGVTENVTYVTQSGTAGFHQELPTQNPGRTVPEEGVPEPGNNPFTLLSAVSLIWAAGFCGFLLYILVNSLRWRNRLKGAKREERNIYLLKDNTVPFVFGLIRPRIYLPAGLSEREKPYILLHEQIHIRRRDYLLKPAAFLIAGLHWFNPLVWAAYGLFCVDMEKSCDERVIKRLGNVIKKEYSTSLLNFAAGKTGIGRCPVAFSENATRNRIKNVLNYRKPAYWMTAASVMAVLLLTAGLFLNPETVSAQDHILKGKNASPPAPSGEMQVPEDGSKVTLREAEELAVRWAGAFSDGDTETLNSLYEGEGLEYEKMSSPWPWREDYRISVEDSTVTIYYYANTSAPDITVFVETLLLGTRIDEEGQRTVVLKESLVYMDTIATYEQFRKAYYIEGAYVFPDWTSGDYGLDEAIAGLDERQQAGSDAYAMDYSLFHDPGKAVPYILKLSGGEVKSITWQEEKKEGGTPDKGVVNYILQDGQEVSIPVFIARYTQNGMPIWMVGNAGEAGHSNFNPGAAAAAGAVQ